MSLEKKIFKRIHAENIRVRPRWQFVAENIVRVFLAALFVILGALSLGAALHIKEAAGVLTAATVPYFWLAFLTVGVLGAWGLIKKFPWAYKRPLGQNIALILAMMVGGGFLSSFGGVSAGLEKQLEKSAVYGKIVPVAQIIEEKREQIQAEKELQLDQNNSVKDRNSKKDQEDSEDEDGAENKKNSDNLDKRSESGEKSGKENNKADSEASRSSSEDQDKEEQNKKEEETNREEMDQKETEDADSDSDNIDEEDSDEDKTDSGEVLGDEKEEDVK